MVGRKARRPDTSSADLPPNVCPNCGGPLEFESNLPEALCATCGIYVEFLGKRDSPPEEAPAPSLDSGIIENALKSDLEELSRSVGLKTSGKKSDLTARLRRYLELREASHSGQSVSGSERAIARRGLVLFLLSLGISRKAAEAMASLFGSLRAFQRAAQDDVELLAGVSPAEALRIREAIAHGETVPPPEVAPPPEETKQPIVPESEPVGVPQPTIAESETQLPQTTIAESETQLILELPPAVEPEPPFEPETEPARAEPTIAPAESTSFDAEVAPASGSRSRRDRWLLYAGTVLQAIGGFGLILGSLLHDVFRVPWLGRNYAAFGSINSAFAVVGVILLMAGLAAIGLSLRGGVARSPSATEV